MSKTLGSLITEIVNHESNNFVELAKIAGLDPKSDFRYRNLRNIDFSGLDLSQFDFRGSNLEGSRFFMTFVDARNFDKNQLMSPNVLKAIAWSEEKRIRLGAQKDRVAGTLVSGQHIGSISKGKKQKTKSEISLPANESNLFHVGAQVSYPNLGIGKLINIEKETVVDIEMEVYIIEFSEIVLRVPTKTARSSGMRSVLTIEKAVSLLSHWEEFQAEDVTRYNVEQDYWYFPVNECEQMISSGNLKLVAEAYTTIDRIQKAHGSSKFLKKLKSQALSLLQQELSFATNINQGRIRTAIQSGAPLDYLGLEY